MKDRMKEKVGHDINKSKMDFSEFSLIDEIIHILIKEYGYSKDRIRVEYRSKTTDGKMTSMDVAVLDKNKDIYIVVEVKRPDYSLKMGENQLMWYMSSSTAEYGILYNGLETRFFKKILGNEIIQVSNIPTEDGFVKIVDKYQVITPDKFWNLLSTIRRDLDHSVSIEILIDLLHVKLYDELKNDNLLFRDLEKKSENILKKEINDFNRKYFQNKFFDTNQLIEHFKSIYPKLIFSISELSISRSNPEIITKIIFEESEQIGKRYGERGYVPDALTSFMYRYIVSGGNPLDLKTRKFLFSFAGMGKIVFDFARYSSEYFEYSKSELTKHCEKNFVVTEINHSNARIIEFLSDLFDLKLKLLKIDDSSYEFDKLFDSIITLPPLGWHTNDDEKLIEPQFRRGKEYHILLKMIEILNPGGLLCTMLLPGFLFRNDLRILRERILSSCYVRGIVHLPSILPYTTIRPVLLLLQKKPNEVSKENYKIFMANFEQKLTKIEKLDSRILNEIWDKFIELHATNQIQEQNEKGFWTTYEEILSNDNNWTISRYDPLLKKLDDLQYRIKLEEYVKIIDFHEIPKNQKNMKEVRLLSPSDIDETGFIKSGGKKVEAPESYLKDYSVKANDLIFCIRGNVGKIGIITHAEENSIINPQLVILRKNDPVVSMILLYSNLKQKFVQIQIDSLKYGSVIYGININDIKNIRLPLPNEYEKTEEETKMTKLRFKIFEQRSKIHELENELTKMLTDLKEKEQ